MAAFETLNNFQLLMQQVPRGLPLTPSDHEKLLAAYDKVVTSHENLTDTANRAKALQADLYHCMGLQSQIYTRRMNHLEARNKVRDSLVEGIMILENTVRIRRSMNDLEVTTSLFSDQVTTTLTAVLDELEGRRLEYVDAKRTCANLEVEAASMRSRIEGTKNKYWENHRLWERMVAHLENLAPAYQQAQIDIESLLEARTAVEFTRSELPRVLRTLDRVKDRDPATAPIQHRVKHHAGTHREIAREGEGQEETATDFVAMATEITEYLPLAFGFVAVSVTIVRALRKR